MAATTPSKKSPYMIEQMPQIDTPREDSKVLKNKWPVATPLFK